MIPSLSWTEGFLHVDLPGLPGGPLEILYLEAYCRAGAHDRDWRETVIPHTTRVTRALRDGSALWLRDTLADGVVVKHAVTAMRNPVTLKHPVSATISFRVEAHNPTSRRSEVHWAQPCIRVGPLAGCAADPDPDAVLPYCFIMLDGQPAYLPTQPWATAARYTPGQVWRAPGIPPEDVNPRPLSPLLPSEGLIGCRAGDGVWTVTTSWAPYHELFLGIYHCIHADFHIGGLAPGETKRAVGWLAIEKTVECASN